ncbi:MAG: CPBP family intramembrane metalloprotease [Gammaproteobacteria bacterium]|nr:CPBP family intramembrane metalloprotease [Gammaproteobacteria bacterium]TVQ50544.1 MAG: CPBP family intramembrane metalloprotease [Gammaproteobacteria bacterium]
MHDHPSPFQVSLQPPRPLPPVLVSARANVLLFLAVTFGWSWSWLLLGGQGAAHAGEGPWLFIALLGPAVGGFTAVISEQGRRGAGLLLRRLAPLDLGWGMWLLALYAVVPLAVLMVLVASPGHTRDAIGSASLLFFLPLVAAFSLLPRPIGVEFGFRGVLLPLCLTRYPPLLAALWVGLLWTLWFAPLWRVGAGDAGMPSLSLFLTVHAVALISMSIVLTLLYLRTGGSLGLSIMVHAALNAAVLPFQALANRELLALPPVMPHALALALTALALWLFFRWRDRRAAPLSPEASAH